jgi:predicted secreted protein
MKPSLVGGVVGDGQIVNYVMEAGSVSKKRFAWLSSTARTSRSSDIKLQAASMVEDLRSGKKLSLGIECVLFIPCPSSAASLGCAREGECTPETGNKPFTASAGACATVTGLQTLLWVLSAVQKECPAASATTRWKDFVEGGADIFVWEAFVSGSEKGADHHDDALLALDAFERSIGSTDIATRVSAEDPLSFAGAVILRSKLSTDLSLLSEPCIVLRPLMGEAKGVGSQYRPPESQVTGPCGFRPQGMK